MFDWLMTSIDPSRPHAVADAIAWHGRLMVLAWGGLLPLGVVIARFWKITPRQDWPNKADNKVWWRCHLALQYGGGVLAAAGLFVVFSRGGGVGGWHGVLGWSVLGLLCVQVLGGWLRGTKGGPTDPAADGSLRGDHYDMTPRRRAFERVHKVVGYLALALAMAGLTTGLWLANAPRWMWLSLGLWWSLLVVLSLVWQRQGRAIDTYQAIWGPDPSHPGNHRAPIGWGIRRPGKGPRS